MRMTRSQSAVILVLVALGFLHGCSGSGPKVGDRLIFAQSFASDTKSASGTAVKGTQGIFEVAKIDEVNGMQIKYSSLAGKSGVMKFDKFENGKLESSDGNEAYVAPDTSDAKCGDIVIGTNSFLEGNWIAAQALEAKDHAVSARFLSPFSGGYFSEDEIRKEFGGSDGTKFTQYVVAPAELRAMICKSHLQPVLPNKQFALSRPDITCQPCGK